MRLKTCLLLAAFQALSAQALLSAEEPSGSAHLAQYKDGVQGDKSVEAAKKLDVKIPMMCREWHIWWGAPYGSGPHSAEWTHWKGEQIYGKYNPETTIERTVSGSSWRRNLNCVGYPLLGPYDSAQPDIVRWQLETARNAGIECLHVQLWPSLWGSGEDMGPIQIFDTLMETAAKLNYPIAVHDEIQFRRPVNGKAQTLESSIKRSSLLLKRYGKHPGWYKIDGMPVYYFQNWSKWISAKDMETYFATVEKEVGPVYWMVEMADIEDYVKVPQLKAFFSHNNAWLIDRGPSKWDELVELQKRAAALARKYGKKFGVLVFNRFDHSHDRGKPGSGLMSGEDGMLLVNSLSRTMETKPDFIVLTQWNDFEECAFLEPAWDFDGFNGDPYRYCRIVAAAQGKAFKPAPLPERSQLDPFIRRKLFGDSKPGDMGPVFQKPSVQDGLLKCEWTDGPEPKEMRIVQGQLASWTPKTVEFKGESLRLANYSAIDGSGVLQAGQELRFYAPGLASKTPRTLWLGLDVQCPEKTKVVVSYHSSQEVYRVDSRWESRTVQLHLGFIESLENGRTRYWTPLYDATLNGKEGDILIRTKGDKNPVSVNELVLWAPDMEGSALKPGPSMKLPQGIAPGGSFVAVAYDALGNPGPPALLRIPQDSDAK